MSTIVVGISIAEGVVLVGVVIALLHLHTCVQQLSHRSNGAVAQMRDWVREAAELSNALTMQLVEQPRAEQPRFEQQRAVQQGAAQPQATDAKPGSHRLVLRFAEAAEGGQSGLVHTQAGSAEPMVTDKRVKVKAVPIVPQPAKPGRDGDRDTVMDPVGLAIQRMLLAREPGIA